MLHWHWHERQRLGPGQCVDLPDPRHWRPMTGGFVVPYKNKTLEHATWMRESKPSFCSPLTVAACSGVAIPVNCYWLLACRAFASSYTAALGWRRSHLSFELWNNKWNANSEPRMIVSETTHRRSGDCAEYLVPLPLAVKETPEFGED